MEKSTAKVNYNHLNLMDWINELSFEKLILFFEKFLIFGRIESVFLFNIKGMLEKDFDKGLKQLIEVNFNPAQTAN